MIVVYVALWLMAGIFTLTVIICNSRHQGWKDTETILVTDGDAPFMRGLLVVFWPIIWAVAGVMLIGQALQKIGEFSIIMVNHYCKKEDEKELRDMKD